MEEKHHTLLTQIASAIADKKGRNIIALDTSELPMFASSVIIAEGNVDRHVRAIANEVEVTLKEVGVTPAYTEGKSSGDWMVLDYVDIVVHLFMPEMREKYQLERLWSEADLIDLDIDKVNS